MCGQSQGPGLSLGAASLGLLHRQETDMRQLHRYVIEPDVLTRDQRWEMELAAWHAMTNMSLGHEATAGEWARIAGHWAGVLLDAAERAVTS